ncbi:TetR/AcrR family transcriptional regulator [Paenibacillus chartarius]|uniref:TetR/AcrR family transcriptional regulator n=1 Tax=Paenibacillus chartarius TaxID=747481 RepID=A0ABV6DUK8_9BACL
MNVPLSPSAGKGLTTTAQTLQEAKLQHTDHLRRSVVQAAAALLQEHGPEAVTVRRVADKMECSTKIIYSLFTGKEGLAKHLYLEGCHLLSRTFESVPLSGDPAADMRLLAHAYWQFSQEHSSFYQVMFGGSFAEFKPDEDSLQGMRTALGQVSELVAGASGEQESLDERKTLETVRLIWAPLHGVIHLYLTGQIGDQEEIVRLYDRTVAMIVHSVFGE